MRILCGLSRTDAGAVQSVTPTVMRLLRGLKPYGAFRGDAER